MPEKPYFVHPTSIVDEGCQIGEGTKIWHFSHVLKASKIGTHCILGQNVSVGPNAEIGNQCKVQNNVSIYKGVTLENGVFCGPGCVFTNVYNPRAFVERKDEFLETVVRTGASIGANATIVCGNTIGKYAFIGAGAVVKKDVRDYAIVAGVPARQIGWACQCGEKLDTINDPATCKRCGNEYRLDNNSLIPIKESLDV
ncbi:MAG: N-acetyltransferase [Planctomycetota bacterium]|nr:MAG: N-acetyltransferase [Planctomycetota bacterium]